MKNQIDNRSETVFLHESAENIWGMTPRQRVERALGRAGGTGQDKLAFRADLVFDEALVKAILAHPGKVLLDETGRPVAGHAMDRAQLAELREALASGDRLSLPVGLTAVDSAGLASNYNKVLRRRGAPYLFDVNLLPAAEIERRMYLASYKGVTDLVTKYLWPVPALLATRFCARNRISPNMVTLASLLCVFLATWLFASGAFASGLLFAWTMCFLDTVDGKLARVTLTSSRWGDVFDHGIDLVHPPFWYWAWYAGLGGSAALAPWVLWVIVAGYILGRIQEGLFIWQFGIELHIWRPLDSMFRLVTARRNPNLLILSAAVILGAPAAGFVAVAWWTAVSFAFHCVRIADAFHRNHRGAPPRSWLTEAA